MKRLTLAVSTIAIVMAATLDVFGVDDGQATITLILVAIFCMLGAIFLRLEEIDR